MKLIETSRLALGLAILSSSGVAFADKEAKVYYFGLMTNTTQRINEKDIERYYDISSLVRGILPDILKLLSSEDVPYGDGSLPDVRLKIITPKGKVVLFCLGGDVTGLGKPHALSNANVRKLHRLIWSALPDDMPRP